MEATLLHIVRLNVTRESNHRRNAFDSLYHLGSLFYRFDKLQHVAMLWLRLGFGGNCNLNRLVLDVCDCLLIMCQKGQRSWWRCPHAQKLIVAAATFILKLNDLKRAVAKSILNVISSYYITLYMTLKGGNRWRSVKIFWNWFWWWFYVDLKNYVVSRILAESCAVFLALMWHWFWFVFKNWFCQQVWENCWSNNEIGFGVETPSCFLSSC